MKKIIYLLFAFLLLQSCANTKDKILSMLVSELGDYTLIDESKGIYEFKNIKIENFSIKKQKIKENIDKLLNSNPTDEKNMQVSLTGDGFYSYYKWDLPKVFVSIWITYPNDKDYLNIEYIYREK